ncbi:MAG: EthD family reductase [Acidobacteriota bacterium]
MVRISVFYPNEPGSRFDMDYYIETHIPLAIDLLSTHPGFKGVSVDKGLGCAPPGSEAAYVAICHFLFESVEAFMAAFTPHATALQGDMPYYTDVIPVIQINEILISK